MEYVIGVSIGERSDRSAVSVVRRRDDESVECVHLQVWQPGTPFYSMANDVVDIVKAILRLGPGKLVRTGRGTIVVPSDPTRAVLDITAVGSAVGSIFVGELEKVGVWAAPFIITAGVTAGAQARVERVPKRELVSVMRMLLEKQSFVYATQLNHAATLATELLYFRTTNSSGREEETDWRSRQHDDLVLATALACWYIHYRLGAVQVVSLWD